MKPLIYFFCACLLFAAPPLLAADNINFSHIHGLSFAADGKRILLASQSGISAYQDGHWYQLAVVKHAYASFTLSHDAMYSSGRPLPESGSTTVYGLKKSTDNGRVWHPLGVAGKTDFPVLAAGYYSDTIYVLNVTASQAMPLHGIYYTLNDGRIWNYAPARFAPEPLSLAAHPRQSGIVAIGSRRGVFLSMDHARSFKALDERSKVYALWFDFDGRHLIYAGDGNGNRLLRVDIYTGISSTINTPSLADDAIAYICQNPLAQEQLAIATLRRNVFISADAGSTWQKIADQGRPVTTMAPEPDQ